MLKAGTSTRPGCRGDGEGGGPGVNGGGGDGGGEEGGGGATTMGTTAWLTVTGAISSTLTPRVEEMAETS